ncbi:hypothetical protein Tco_0389162 [Tanacetum coccineum]
MSSPDRSTSDIEDAFSSMNILNYTSASSDYFPDSAGSSSFNSSENSNDNMIPPVISSFYNNTYLKDVQAIYAKELPISSPDPITPPAILTPSPVLPSSLLFDPRYFFVHEELLPPKKQTYSPPSSSTTYGYSSVGRFDVFFRNQLLVFQQHQDESLYDSWTRFKDIIQKVPNHGLSIWTLIEIFLKHLDSLSCHIINLTAEGDLRKFSDIGACPESTTQTLPLFEEYTPPVTYPEEVEKTLGTPIEVEPLNETKLEEVGLNCNHNTPFSSREVPSFDGPEPQPLFNSPSLDDMFDDDWGLESKEVSPLGEELSLFDRPNEVERGIILEAHRLESILQQQISQHMAPSHHGETSTFFDDFLVLDKTLFLNDEYLFDGLLTLGAAFSPVEEAKSSSSGSCGKFIEVEVSTLMLMVNAALNLVNTASIFVNTDYTSLVAAQQS